MSWGPLRELVKKYVISYNHFDLETMLDCFADNCKFTSMASGSQLVTVEGKPHLRELAAQSAAYFIERTQTVTNWIFTESQAAIEVEYKSMLKRDLPNGLKAGAELNMRGVSIFRFENDKIVELTDYC